MTVLDGQATDLGVDYALYDADEHYYETEDALTRHLDPAFRQVVRWVDMDGRRTLLVNDRLLTVVPNPTYDPVGVPGSLEPYFRAENTEGLPMRNIIEMHRLKPEYRERDKRVAVMDAQGVERAWVLPSLGPGLEGMLLDHSQAPYAVFRADNTRLRRA